MKIKVADRVRLIYDGYPFKLTKDYGYGEVVKVTPTGLLRIIGYTKDAITQKRTDRSELFDPRTGYAKGWNTLWFEQLEENDHDIE